MIVETSELRGNREVVGGSVSVSVNKSGRMNHSNSIGIHLGFVGHVVVSSSGHRERLFMFS
jgi:hypothetical protein